MKKIILIAIVIFPFISLRSQQVDYLKDVGSLSDNQNYNVDINGSEMNVDSEGNVYILGRYYDQAALKPNFHPVFQPQTPFNNYFLCKMDSDGNLLWHKNFFSEDLYGQSQNGISFSYIHERFKIHFYKDDIFLTGSYKNKIWVDSFESDLNTHFANNGFIFKMNKNGDVKFLVTAQDYSANSSEYGAFDLAFGHDGIMYAAFKMEDTLKINDHFIYGTQHINNKASECAIVKMDIESGKVIGNTVLASSSGNGIIEANKLLINKQNQLVAIGRTTRGLVVDGKAMSAPSAGSNMYIAFFDENLKLISQNIKYGNVRESDILYLNNFATINDHTLAFSGFFRGSDFSLLGSEIPGTLNTFNMFFGILDVETFSCRLFSYGNINNAYISNIEMSSDDHKLYLFSSFGHGQARLLDSLITIPALDDGKLILTTLDLSSFEYNFTNLPAIRGNQAIGIENHTNNIYLAANYYKNYSINALEVNSSTSDIWFLRLAPTTTFNIDANLASYKIYPNPTSGPIIIEDLEFDRLVVRDSYGKIVVTASRQQAEQALINLGAQTYILTFYKADQQVGSQKVFVNN